MTIYEKRLIGSDRYLGLILFAFVCLDFTAVFVNLPGRVVVPIRDIQLGYKFGEAPEEKERKDEKAESIAQLIFLNCLHTIYVRSGSTRLVRSGHTER